MKRFVLALGLAGLVLAQHPKKTGPKRPPTVTQTAPDPEEQWACGFGTRRDRNGDHCLCPAMVAEVRTEIIDNCHLKHGRTQEEFIKCLADVPSECDIVKNADLKHPVHSCKRGCSTKAICRCHDSPKCVAPPLVRPDEGDDQQ